MIKNVNFKLQILCALFCISLTLLPIHSALNIKQYTYQATKSIIYVDDDNTEGPWNGSLDFPYQKIQDAINESSNNDIIYVFNGEYFEHIIINKNLSLVGESAENTIIDGSNIGKIVSIPNDGVSFSNFTVRNAGIFTEDSGIYIRADHTTLDHIIIKECSEGIFLRDAKENIILNSIIFSCEYGIFLSNSNSGNQMLDNMISSCYEGIYLEESNNNNLNSNYLNNNEFGVGIKSASNGNSITGNHFEGNANVGLEINDLSNRNIVYHNNFVDNTIHATFTMSFLTEWKENYWDDWVGIEFSGYEFLPKFIFGYIVDPIIWINFDMTPQKEPYFMV